MTRSAPEVRRLPQGQEPGVQRQWGSGKSNLTLSPVPGEIQKNTRCARFCRITVRLKLWSLKLQERWREHACSPRRFSPGTPCREQPVSNIQSRRPVSWNHVRGMREMISFWRGIHKRAVMALFIYCVETPSKPESSEIMPIQSAQLAV